MAQPSSADVRTKRVFSGWRLFFIASLMLAGSAAAQSGPVVVMPGVAELQTRMAVRPGTFRVVEPHLSLDDRQTKIDYVGYPASSVFDVLLGPGWKDVEADIEFRALDGYVSRIEIARFRQYPAYLVFAIKAQSTFTVDNVRQNQKNVPLGPYYLIWDNIRSPELLGQEAADWPYQIRQIALSTARKDALLPGNLSGKYAEHAGLAQKHCLTCHRVNGYGGDKWPIDLAVRARAMKEDAFLQWVLQPSAQKPGTTMPPLLVSHPDSQRQDAARKIYRYFLALPAKENPAR